jgi:hypothetical protein
MSTSLDDRDLFAGLITLSLPDEPISLGQGIVLTKTHAKFLTPLTLVNTSPPSDNPMKARVEYWQCATNEQVISAEIQIPKSFGKSFDERYEVAQFIVLMLRLWSDPSIGLHVISCHSFSELCVLPENEKRIMFPIESHQRFFKLGTIDPSSVVPSIQWVTQHWEQAFVLYKSSAEFRLAADSLDSGQFVPNHALTLVSLWGALEALFSPSTSELKFRVSALIAAYLEPPGIKRQETQKHVASLYDMRSAAAHGKPRHQPEHLLKSFELVRKVLIQIIHDQIVPTKDALERRLFGAS